MTILYLLTGGTLVLGLLLYVIFRENTYIAEFVEKAVPLTSLRDYAKILENNFFKFYFPDFLWAFSLSGCFHIIVLPGAKGSVLCGLSAGFFGVLFEVLQSFGVVNGTADIVDAVLYVTAGIIYSTIYIILSEKEQEE